MSASIFRRATRVIRVIRVKTSWLGLALALALAARTGQAQRSSSELKALARERLAKIDGELSVSGLDSAVEVRRDKWGVPHIYARTQHDLFFAQGLVAAQDRLFQMDMWRRIGEGKLAEVLGPQFVERDRMARLLKYRGDMGAEWTSYAPDTREIATAFVAGVNAYVDAVRERPPMEFTLLGFAPQHWTPDVPLQRMAALSMTGNADSEAMRARLIALIGVKRAAELWPTIPYVDLDPAPGVSLDGITSRSLGAYGAATGGVRYPRIEGSNNWVISGARSATGKPLLANDPHRSLDNPSLRYLTHLVGPGWNVIGAGEPGVPGVAGGHNERIAFGFTIVGMDQQDVYVETLGPCPPTNLGKRCYREGAEWRPLTVIIDTIPVKGEAPRIARLEFTRHGPLLSSQAAGRDGTARGFALRFVGSEPGTAGYLAQLSVDRAGDWQSFLDAAARWKLPTENLIYADVDGNIGWIAAGLMPKRKWSGLLPVPGAGGFEWTGFRTAGELPQSYNPPAGFIATANHDIRPEFYKFPLNYEFDTPFRAHRIMQVLSDKDRKFGVDDFKQLQHDELSSQARALAPFLRSASARLGKRHWVLDELTSWDFVMRADAREPALFEFFWRSLGGLLLRRLTESAEAQALLGEGWLNEFADPMKPLRLVPQAQRDTLMLLAANMAVSRLRAQLGADSSAWRWGSVHTAAFPHRVAAAFDLAPVPRGGNAKTVNATGGANYRQTSGASYREILDVADWDRSVATSVPGQSGQPESEYYANLLPLWARGEYFPLAYSRPAVERETAHILWLRPVAP